MKTKIKRHSRSVLSVVLALCMLLSCMTAGMIMTDAAKVDSEAVGDNLRDIGNADIYLYGDFNSWSESDDWKLTKVNSNEYSGCFAITGSGNKNFKLVSGGKYYSCSDTNSEYGFNANWNGDTGAITFDDNAGRKDMQIQLGSTSTTVYAYVYLWKLYGSGSRFICDIRKPYFHRAGSSSDFGTNYNVTNSQMNLKSGSAGIYTISNLPAGQYFINVDMNDTRQTNGIITSISTGAGVSSGNQSYNHSNETYNYCNYSEQQKNCIPAQKKF